MMPMHAGQMYFRASGDKYTKKGSIRPSASMHRRRSKPMDTKLGMFPAFFSCFSSFWKLWKWAKQEFCVAVHRRANSMRALFTHTAKE